MKSNSTEHHFTKKQILSEEEDIRKAKKNLKDFEVLYNRYYIRIFQFIYQRVQTENQAADLTSETFIKAMENLKSYKFMGLPFASWLFRIARNEIYLQHKKGNKIRQVNFQTADINSIAEEINEPNNSTEILIDAIKKLNSSDTELIEMKYFEKRSYAEIALILNSNENNVKVKTFRVVQKLKSIINPSKK